MTAYRSPVPTTTTNRLPAFAQPRRRPTQATQAGRRLGTFGLVRHEESDPPYVMQLAVNSSEQWLETTATC